MSILKTILALFFLICTLYGTDVTPPTKTLHTSGGATDIVATSDKIYISTAMGSVDIFDKSSKTFLDAIRIEKIKDFMGDVIESKIYSIDVMDDKVLIVSQGEKGGRNIFSYHNKKLQTIVSDKERCFISQAKFLNESTIVYATLGNQIIAYDFIKKEELYNEQIGHSRFSYFVLNESKERLIIADESGNLKVINTQNGQVQTSLDNQNLDNVFQVDWKNKMILTAGQDRRSVLYSALNLQPYVRKSGFLIYGCALSDDASLAAYSSDEQNNVLIYDTLNKKNLYKLTGNTMTISKILFLSNDEILIGTDTNRVNYYKLVKE